MVTVYLAHDLDKAAKLRAHIVIAEFPGKFPRWPSVDYRIASDYYTHVEGGNAEDCRLLLNMVLDAIGDRR